MKHVLDFHYEKKTKGAVQYKEYDADGNKTTNDNAVIGTLYVRKSAYGTQTKQPITVTVELP